MRPLIEIQALDKILPSPAGAAVKILKDISFSVPAGQTVALLGPKRAGKSMLLQILAGRVAPTHGRVLMDGREVTPTDAQSLQKRIHYTTGKLLRKRPDLPPSPLLLIDSLDLDVDKPAHRKLLEWLAQMRGRHGRTILLSTSKLKVACELCDRFILLHAGRVLADRPVTVLQEVCRRNFYALKVKGRLGPQRASWFDGFSLRYAHGVTTLSGEVIDQSALHGLLAKVRDLGLTLLSVQNIPPKIEHIMPILLQ